MDTFENNKPVNGHDDMPETTPETTAEVAEDTTPEVTAEVKEEETPVSTDETTEATEAEPSAGDEPHTGESDGETSESGEPDGFFAEGATEDRADTSWHTTSMADPMWRAEPDRPRSPYADSPYVSYDEAQRSGTTEQWRASFDDAPTEKPKKERKKKKPGMKKVIAAALACAVVGSALGAIITGTALNRKWENTAAGLQAQIDELSGSGNGVVIHSASTPVSNGQTAPDGTMTPAQVYNQNVSSVISVTTTGYTTNGWTTSQFASSGSGFIISADGYILTNYHVIEGYSAVEVTTIDSVTYDAEVVGYDALSDVALLKVEAEDLPCVIMGDSDVAAVGDMVAAIGNPLGELASTQTVGYISAKNRMVNTDGTILNMIQTDAAINSGNSGGPLFNMYGQVIGITTAKYSGSSSSGATIEGIGFAIPINTVMELLGDLMEYGYVTGQAYMGVGLLEMDASVAQSYGLPTGPKVASVEEGSAAQKAGIQEGDIITGLGDVEVSSYSDLTYALRSYRVGDTATIHIYRAGQELELSITFDEKPATTTTETEPTESQSGGYGNFPGWP